MKVCCTNSPADIVCDLTTLTAGKVTWLYCDFVETFNKVQIAFKIQQKITFKIKGKNV